LAISAGGSLTEESGILAKCIATIDSKEPGGAIGAQTVNFKVEAVPVASALSGFGDSLRKARGLPVDETLDDLAVAVALNDIATVGRLLGPRDVNTMFRGKCLPESLVRRPLKCSLLDVAVGSGSIEMT
jgi:hypothetical protein